MTGVWFPSEQPPGVLDGVNERPVQVEHLASGAASEDDAGQGSAARAARGQLAAKVLERDGLVSRELGQPGFEGDHGFGVGERISAVSSSASYSSIGTSTAAGLP